MKKKSMLLAVLLMTSIFNVSFAAPAPYVDYLYNDTNYPIIGGRQGVGRYLDLTSLDIIKNDQFGVEFEVNVLSVNHNVDDWENKQPIVWTFHYFKNIPSRIPCIMWGTENMHLLLFLGSGRIWGIE